MLSELSIPRSNNADPAFDQKQLYAIGLQHIRDLSRKIWTDYNLHDPGITILELLSYTLTDLSYRASLPVKDLLAEETGGTTPHSMHTALNILTNRPLTAADYRKQILYIEGVRNAWIEPVTKTCYADTFAGKLLREKPGRPGVEEVRLRGLYRVLIDCHSNVSAETIMEKAKKMLLSNRNLCEDFVQFSTVDTQQFRLCGDIELAPKTVDITALKAQIYHKVQQYLTPSIRFYSLDELLTKEKTDGSLRSADEIFEGYIPKPADATSTFKGFIDNEELASADLRQSIRLSDIISIIMDIEGVMAVRNLAVRPAVSEKKTPADVAENNWVLSVMAGKKAVLDPERFNIRFYKKNMPVLPDEVRFLSILDKMISAEKSAEAQTLSPDFPIPQGTFRFPEEYFSFQNHFPEIYGLSEAGQQKPDDLKSKSLAYQLKAYLLFFDQIMANYFAQLGHVRELFSTDPEMKKSYFHQVVTSFKDYEKIYAVENDDPEKIGTMLDGITMATLTDVERRNQFLDHLLARFAERFHEYANIMQSAFGAVDDVVTGDKCHFLNNYPEISSGRGVGYNDTLRNDGDRWDSANISGLEKRIALLLGIRNVKRRDLAEIISDSYAELDALPVNEFRFRIRQRDTGKIILSSSTKFNSEQMALDAMKQAIQYASSGIQYYKKSSTSSGRFYFNIVDDNDKVLARRIEYFSDEQSVNIAIASTLSYLQEHYSQEGMFLVENILLRPEYKNDPFLPICKHSEQQTCSDTDPYSYRIHLILPAYAGRFRNMDFRTFAEQVIREETPAHILPKICWISSANMSLFEKAYRNWLLVKSGTERATRKKSLESLIDILYTMKTVYPKQTLNDCSNNDPKFILGSSALGSFNTQSQVSFF